MLDINKELEKFNELLRDEDDLTRTSRTESKSAAPEELDSVDAPETASKPPRTKKLTSDTSTQSARESKVVHRPIVTAQKSEDREAIPPVSNLLELEQMLDLGPLESDSLEDLALPAVSDEAKSAEARALLDGARGALRSSIVRESREREGNYRKRVRPLELDTNSTQGLPADWTADSTADRLDVVFGYAATLSGWAKSPAVYAVAACLALVAVAGSVFNPFDENGMDLLVANAAEGEVADNRAFFGDMLEVNESVEIALITEPDGAAVYVDGEYVGLSPIMSLAWAAGTSTIYIAKEDYQPIDSVVVLGGNRLMAFTMDPLNGIEEPEVVEDDQRGLGIDLLVTDLARKPENLNAKAPGLNREESIVESKPAAPTPATEPGPTPPASEALNSSAQDIAPSARPVEIIEKAPAKDLPVTGSLILTSEPSGAEVMIDGSSLGRTPLTLDGVATGPRQLVFKQDGYESFATAVDVGAAIRTPLHAVLEGRPGALVITMNAPGKVYVDGALRTPAATNIAEIKVGAGRHEVLVVSSAYGEQKANVQIASDSRTDLSIDFMSGPFNEALKDADRLRSSGDLDAAVIAYKKALSIRPEDTATRDKLGGVEMLIADRDRKARLSRTVIQDGVYLVADEMPQLIGGLKKLHETVRYPEAAYQAGVQGRVYVDIVVDEKGRVRDASVTRGIGFGCDEEALRAVKKARFTPGKVSDVAVPVRQSLFVNFQID